MELKIGLVVQVDLLGSNVETAALFMWIRLDQKIGHLVQIDLLGAKSRAWLPRLDGSAWIIKQSGGPIPGTTGAAIPSLYSQHTLGSSHLHLIENYTALPTALVYIYSTALLQYYTGGLIALQMLFIGRVTTKQLTINN